MSLEVRVIFPSTSEQILNVTQNCFRGSGALGSAAAIAKAWGMEKTSIALAAASVLSLLGGFFVGIKQFRFKSKNLKKKIVRLTI